MGYVILMLLATVVAAWAIHHLRFAGPHEWLIVEGSGDAELARGGSRWLGPNAAEAGRIETTVRRITGRHQRVSAADGEVVLDWDLHAHVSIDRWRVRNVAYDLVYEDVQSTAQKAFQEALHETVGARERTELVEERDAWQSKLREAVEERLAGSGVEVCMVSAHAVETPDDVLRERSATSFASMAE